MSCQECGLSEVRGKRCEYSEEERRNVGVWMGEGGGEMRVCSEIVCVLFVTYDTWS